MDKSTSIGRTDILVGEWSDTYGVRYRFKLDVELRQSRGGLELSFMGSAYRRTPHKHRWEEHTGGQNREDLLKVTDFAPGFTSELRDQLSQIWERWHLNGMRAGCEHQRAEKWNERPIDPEKPTNAYGNFYPGQRHNSWNMLVWISPTEYPAGLMTVPCETCGYRYGTAWLHEELPADVIKFVTNLIDPSPEGLASEARSNTT